MKKVPSMHTAEYQAISYSGVTHCSYESKKFPYQINAVLRIDI